MCGWIKIHRKMMDDEWYFSEKFTRMQAWLDLLLLAEFKPRKIYVRGIEVSIGVGQVAMSLNELAERWQWSRNKVIRFFYELQNNGKVKLQKSNVINLISIVKYEEYQIEETAKRTTNETANETTKQKKVTKENIKKNNKEITSTIVEVKKENDAAVAATLSQTVEKRRTAFYNSLVAFLGKYDKTMIREFYDYWSELNRSKTKMRFEQQPTWETARRLAVWANRDKNRTSYGGIRNITQQTAEQRAEDAASIVARLLAENEAGH